MQLSLFSAELTKKEEKEYQDLVTGLKERFEKHTYIVKHGANDPFWHDGINLMLIRNHILWYKRKLYTFCNGKLLPLPSIALKPIPPEYPLDFCVNCRPHHR